MVRGAKSVLPIFLIIGLLLSGCSKVITKSLEHNSSDAGTIEVKLKNKASLDIKLNDESIETPSHRITSLTLEGVQQGEYHFLAVIDDGYGGITTKQDSLTIFPNKTERVEIYNSKSGLEQTLNLMLAGVSGLLVSLWITGQ